MWWFRGRIKQKPLRNWQWQEKMGPDSTFVELRVTREKMVQSGNFLHCCIYYLWFSIHRIGCNGPLGVSSPRYNDDVECAYVRLHRPAIWNLEEYSRKLNHWNICKRRRVNGKTIVLGRTRNGYVVEAWIVAADRRRVLRYVCVNNASIFQVRERLGSFGSW